ncbi:MAG: YidC/Oxa1 family membrane protein insertase [Clostridia bacterium]|nr:YidC/Oxa1 family membrane protein insertase [Clostridia bacterium]
MDSFFQILYVPFGFLFRILFDFVGNYGLALVIFTLFFRLILLPSAVKQQKGMAKQYRLQPKLKRIREKYQDYAPNERNQKIQMETNELYQQEGYSAMSAGCLPMLLQLPILWGLYGIIRMPLTHVLGIGEEAVTALTTAVQSLGETSARTVAYAESLVISRLTELLEANPDLVTKFPEAIQKIQAFDFRIFGIDLGTIPSTETFRNWAEASTEAKLVLLIPILSGITSLMTSVLSQVRQKKTNPDAQMQGMGCMMLSMPLMSLWFTFQFPAGMGMYWILSNVFAFFQTLILGHFYAPRKTVAQHMVAETIERRSYEKAKKSAADKEKNEQN